MGHSFRRPLGQLGILLGLLGGGLPTAYGQGWSGIGASNYAGTNALPLNPSSIADSRYRLYINVAGADVNLYNNYLKVNAPYGLWPLAFNNVQNRYRNAEGNVIFRESYLKEDLTGRAKFLTLSAEARLPSVQISLPHGQAVAFSSRVRGYFQVNNVSQNVARLNTFGLGRADDLGLANELLRDSRFSANLNAWQEINGTYARELTPNARHYFKAGITVKYLVGLGAGYINNQGLGYVVYNSDSIQVSDRDVTYGHTDYRYYHPSNGFKRRNLYNKNRLGRGLGLDLGLTYEFRPEYERYNYTMDGEKGLTDPESNKYKLRVGAAIVDLGRIKYAHPAHVSSSRLAPTGTVQIGSLDTLSFHNLDQLDGLVDDLVQVESRTPTFKSRLPHTLNLTADYHLSRNWYVGALWSQSLLSRYAIGVRTFSRAVLVPRFERRRVEVSLPLALADDYRRAAIGAMLRVGPVFLGSDNLGGVFGWGRVSGYDLYAGVAVTLAQHKPRDRDHDGVSDKVDVCPDVPGVWEFKGCPDRDGDHIADSNDDCPDTPGLVEFRGCPDRDGDRIIDRDDECPDLAGIPEFRGCPDRDADHVPDAADRCPDVPGDPAHAGCPDTDKDGLFDPDDRCPTVPGPAANGGCPYPDTDGDGVPDPTDKCPNTPGPPGNDGCPVLTPVEVEVLNTAFSNLEFEFKRAVIQPSSFPALRELANLLDKKTTARLLLSGHTDNIGTPEANDKLSRLRATAVKDYLVSQGIAPERFIVEWFGPTRPLDTNETAAGRDRNRRVEMKVLFE